MTIDLFLFNSARKGNFERVVAEICSRDGYAGLMAAMRARILELNTTMECIDDLAGLPTRYTGKVLAPGATKLRGKKSPYGHRFRMRGIGKDSLGPLLGALGLKILVVEDTAALAQIAGRITRREVGPRHTNDGIPTKRKRHKSRLKGNSAWGRMMAARRFLLQSPASRSAKARNAIRARWRKTARS